MIQTAASEQNTYARNNTPDKNDSGYEDVSKLKRQYLDYLHVKQDEIKEAQQSRHYYHGNQWTKEQIAILKKRGQPVVTSNRVGRKVDATVGLLEKMRQDPKAYARTPKHEEGAEIATAAVRYVLDVNEWKSKSPESARDGAIEGIGGVELNIVPGDMGDPDVEIDIVDPDLFFYDPRSFREDFSDARYMGVAKWIDLDLAKEMFPDKAEELDGMMDSGVALGSDTDRERKWVNSDMKRLRLIDHWYIKNGEWKYCIYISDEMLMEGDSYLHDEKGKSVCRYIMFSAFVDHDGDRYGFIRNMKSAQDEINARRSKALHNLSSRRMIARKGTLNIETLRREAARPDGVIEWEVEKPEFDDARSLADMQGQLKFLEDSKAEIENYGFNPALIGTGVQDMSGRAIALQQQAGMAELGPYIMSYRGWKIRLYRAVYFAVREHWKAERWIRVTDDEGVAQFVQVNGMDVQNGMPAMINSLGSLDVDIIMDEGADTINMVADAYDTLSTLAAKGAQVPPGLLIELAPIQPSIKKKYLEQMQKDPMQEQAKQIAMQGEVSKVEETKANTALKQAQTIQTLQSAGQPDIQSTPQFELSPEIQAYQAISDANSANASADHKRAQADNLRQQTALAPLELLHNAHNAEQDRQLAAQQARQRQTQKVS